MCMCVCMYVCVCVCVCMCVCIKRTLCVRPEMSHEGVQVPMSENSIR